jgi:kynureninase
MKPKNFDHSYAIQLSDPFEDTRKKFLLNESEINLNVNSLGVPHVNAISYVHTYLEHWVKYGVKGHYTDIVMQNGTVLPGYAYILDAFREPARKILGAKTSDETAVFPGQSIAYSILFRWLAETQREKTSRTVILYQKSSFPADKSIIETQTRVINACAVMVGEAFKLIQIPENVDGLIDEEALMELMKTHSHDLALIAFGDGGVSWKTGQILNLGRIGNYAKKIGAKFLVNIAHAIGTKRLELHDWNVSAAVGCLYKNMSAGAGGPSLVFIHEDEFENLDMLGLSGWFGSHNPIETLQGKTMLLKRNAQRIEVSNPCVLSLLPAYAALEEYCSHDSLLIQTKSNDLLSYFDELMRQIQKQFDNPVRIITPDNQRAMEIMFSLKDSRFTSELHQYLEHNKMVCDMRGGDTIRIGMFPLITSFSDLNRLFNNIWNFFDRN